MNSNLFMVLITSLLLYGCSSKKYLTIEEAFEEEGDIYIMISDDLYVLKGANTETVEKAYSDQIPFIKWEVNGDSIIIIADDTTSPDSKKFTIDRKEIQKIYQKEDSLLPIYALLGFITLGVLLSGAYIFYYLY